MSDNSISRVVLIGGLWFLVLQLFYAKELFAYDTPPGPPSPGRHLEDRSAHEGRGGFVARLDRDGDSRVSRREFDGPPGAFDLHDKNKDGYLTEDERPLIPPPHHQRNNREHDRIAPPQEAPPVVAVEEQPVVGQESKAGTASNSETAAEKEVAPQVVVNVKGESPRERWLLLGIVLALIACILALGWSIYSIKRFKKVKEAMRSLNPHLLGVSVDKNIMITEVSDALCKATGFRGKDLVGKPLMALGSHTADNPNAMDEMWRKIKTGTAWKGEVKLVRKDGTVIWADAVISPSRRKKENPTEYTVIYQDASKRKHYEKLSTRDELTGLFNRRHFNEVSTPLLKKTYGRKDYFVLCLLDVDNFKAYNDQYGHPAGDRVLEAIGKSLIRLFQRRDDLAFRLGGEEFGGIITVKDKEEAISFSKKILEEIRRLKIPHEKNPPGIVTVSIGVNMVAGNKLGDVDAVYKKADQALYRAKEAGRNRIVAILQ